MKVVHSNIDANGGWQQSALQLERTGDFQQAIQIYEQAIKRKPFSEFSYNRLMIIYRKQKQYRKELHVIKEGIKAFQKLYHSAKPPDKKIAQLSKAIIQSTGLSDKKGNSLFLREPIGRWSRRKEVTEKKLNHKRG